MLCLDPVARFTCAEILEHGWMATTAPTAPTEEWVHTNQWSPVEHARSCKTVVDVRACKTIHATADSVVDVCDDLDDEMFRMSKNALLVLGCFWLLLLVVQCCYMW